MTLAALFAGNTRAVTLGFDPAPGAAGYFLYRGEASGDYTQRTDLGIATTAQIGGLDLGVTYYFVATAYDSAGDESLPSDEVAFTPGLGSVSIQSVTASGVSLLLTGTGPVVITASPDLSAWSPLASATLNGALVVTDTTAAQQRFYRVEGQQ